MNISIKNRIYLSFYLLVGLFIINGAISIATLYHTKKMSDQISEVGIPSVNTMYEFKKMLTESKMYSTNWVYLRYAQKDKIALLNLHNHDYFILKNRSQKLAGKWTDHLLTKRLNTVFKEFEELLAVEKEITGSLKKFSDYDNPVIRLEAERLIEDEVIPRTSSITTHLNGIIDVLESIRQKENADLEKAYANLRLFIILLSVTFVCIGGFLSVYFSKIIIKPLENIRSIINEMGKGITQLIPQKAGTDEIGEMIASVNNLSKKLDRSAHFANETGNRNFNVAFSPLSDKDTLGKALLAMRDNLKQSDAQLNEAHQIAHLGSWEREIKSNKIYWSDELFAIFEISSETFDLHQQSFLNLIHPEDLERVKMLCSREPACLEDRSYECRIITPLGNIKYLYIEDKGVIDATGNLVKTKGIVQDITERKKASLQLEQAHFQLNKILQNTDQVVFACDMVEERVLLISSAVDKTFGYPADAFLDDFYFWRKRVYKDDLPVFDSSYAALFNGTTVHGECRIVHKDNTIRWLECRIAPTLDITGKLLRIDGVVGDVSPRKEAELERDRITRDLIHRNKDLEQFSYIVSHNLRSPVANIMGLSQLINLTYHGNDVNLLKYLQGISTSVTKLDGIIRDLSQIISIRTPGNEQKEEVNLYNLVDDIKGSIQHMIDAENVTITCNFDAFENVFTLKSYLYSIFYNLIVNSIKYKQQNIAPRITICSSIDKNTYQISLTDNSKGIDTRRYGSEVFMLYKRFDTSVEGKGIGLYMTKTAVETLGGRISLESQLNKGSKFIIEFECTDQQAESCAVAKQIAATNLLNGSHQAAYL